MRNLLFLVLLSLAPASSFVASAGDAIATAEAPAANIDAKMVVGTWRDENSVIEYTAEGRKNAAYDFGLKVTGTWALEGDVIVFTPDQGQRAPATRQKIVKLTTDTMDILSPANGVTYHAVRQK